MDEQAIRDPNYVPVVQGVSTEDSQDTISLRVDPNTKELLTSANIGGFDLPNYDYVSMALSAGNTTETYTFKDGGSGGVEVAEVVIVYTNSTRDVLVSATKT